MQRRGRHIPLILALSMLAAVPPTPTFGQGMRLGLTWSIPSDPLLAEQDLRDMRTAGFVAVRVGEIVPTELLYIADTLGMLVYQDLPFRALPTDQLTDTLGAARSVLADIVLATHRHPSLRAIGLADLPDSSDPLACPYLAMLTDVVRASAASGTATYFTTKFVDSDQCSPTTDLVLFDLLDVDVATIRRHARAITVLGSRAGVGRLGTWTDLSIKKRGLSYGRSPESQARYLERALKALRETIPAGSPQIVFVHRWRDPAGLDDVFADVEQRRYGLLNSADGRRPIFEVAAGFATGKQIVFAFPAGGNTSQGWTWMTLLGWGLISALGIAYATSPRMRHMVPRYFIAHGFYREAVISGRESLVSETLALLGSFSVGIGMLMAILLRESSYLPLFSVGNVWLSPAVRNFLGALLDQPWTLTVILASAVALTYVVWISVLSFLTRSRQTLLPAQVMMLVVWPHWPLLTLLLVSPALVSVEAGHRLPIVATAVGLSIALIVIASIRTAIDYRLCSRVSAAIVVTGLLLHPLMLCAASLLLLATSHPTRMEYLWHLLTRI